MQRVVDFNVGKNLLLLFSGTSCRRFYNSLRTDLIFTFISECRIVSDRAFGKVFFNNDRLMDYELLGFGGRATIEKEMAKLGKKAVLPPLVPFNSTEWPWKIDPNSGTAPKSFDDLHKAGLLKVSQG